MADLAKQIKKRMYEWTDKNIGLLFTKDSVNVEEKDYDQLFELSHNGVMINPKDEETPGAWDAGFSIEDLRGSKHLVISGGAGPSGFGSVEIKIPITAVNGAYNIIIEPKDDASAEKIKAILAKYKIGVGEAE